MIKKLPIELLDKIFDFDGRYKESYKNVLNELINKVKWFDFRNNNELESMIIYESILSEDDREYIQEIRNRSFSKFYFEKFCKKQSKKQFITFL